MRQSRVSVALIWAPVLIIVSLLGGCGGGTPQANVATSITVTPSPISMNKGDVASVTATAYDKSNNTVLAQFTYSSADTSLATVNASGQICAGTWDTNGIVCTAASKAGSTTVTVKSGTISASVTVYVHDKVDAVQVNTPPGGCLSSGNSEQLTATAYSKNPTVCAAMGATVPCALPADSLGTYVWAAYNSGVVALDNSTTIGLATGAAPGSTSVYASIAGNNSPAVPFTTCPIVSLSVITQGGNASPFTAVKSDSRTLQATAVDSKGKTLVNPPLSWISNNAYAFTVAGSTTASTATVTAGTAGAAMLSVACSSPSCNVNMSPIYSNPILGNVTGTAGYTVFAGSTSSTTLIPIDSSGKAGTAITLPQIPNSMLFNRQGTKALLGATTTGAMVFDPSTSAATTLGVIGKAISVSPDGTYGVLSDSAHNAAYIVNLTQGVITAGLSPITGGPTSASFTPDDHYLFLANGTTNYWVWDATSQVMRKYSATTPVNDVSVLANGPAVYFAGGQANAIIVHATCQPTSTIDTQLANAPTMIRALKDASGAVALDLPNAIVLNNIQIDQSCPPVMSETRAAVDLGQGSTMTPSQWIVTPDGTKAILAGNTGNITVLNVTNDTPTTVALAGSATAAYTGDVTADSLFYFVGASDGTVHEIDLTKNTDAQQTSVSLKDANGAATNPDIVAIQDK